MTGSLVITQGEHLASADPGVTISTLLGSCVACCLWDPSARVGGMNHILLGTLPTGSEAAPTSAAVHSMELLVNELLKLGAARGRLQAKAFGGASMVAGLSDIGARNGRFLLDYLGREDIPCLSQSLGGALARQIVFIPVTGAVRMKFCKAVMPEPVETGVLPGESGVELFR